MIDDAPRPRVYLAGPEVFFPNAREQGEIKKRLCAERGFEGVYPLDNEISGADVLSPEALARAISHGNERLMRSCDLVIANCTPFRGVSMDTGTAFEIGFMRALGRPVFGYSNVTVDYAARVRATPSEAHAVWCLESRGADIEDFGLSENLMIAIAVLDTAGRFVMRGVAPDRLLSDLGAFEACLALAREIVSGGR
ncbi:nucleoside 2-deoxyribosyltransferase [Hyphomicrobium sp.]|uniref:nucleoside 2-deoxyribosyltransferase n=1 Tax=Hyphomicrobium sp. TaxID=82 RepID=UPI002C439CB9|nr:nucleoside 2-deoxyribosyltransferase [Hyphomicrobium sp.]HRN89473.1 nucleoside 2-deoxyribosyltransferase [Hyphomicrobium sp.]HRQ27121.1 nucleoside 2-deoxyribosyltransferase [Hyphomicrobium sp.]